MVMLSVLFKFYLFFCQFQPGDGYESVASCNSAETYSEPCKISKMERLVKKVDG